MGLMAVNAAYPTFYQRRSGLACRRQQIASKPGQPIANHQMTGFGQSLAEFIGVVKRPPVPTGRQNRHAEILHDQRAQIPASITWVLAEFAGRRLIGARERNAKA
jgi:hypothetical protein